MSNREKVVSKLNTPESKQMAEAETDTENCCGGIHKKEGSYLQKSK